MATDLSPSEQREIIVAEIRELNAILADEPWNVGGLNGQPRPHWALTARRHAMDALRKLDRQNPPDKDAATELDAFLEG